MKKILLYTSIATVIFLLNACDKKGQTTLSGNSVNQNESARFAVPEAANSEAKRIYNDMVDNDYTFGIIDNTNYGTYHPDLASHIMFSGKTEPSDDISVELNDETYSPKTNGQWLKTGIVFKNYIGVTVNVKIKSGSTLLSENDIYVPSGHLASRLTLTSSEDPCKNGGEINRTGNTLNWTPDPANTSGYVLLKYSLCDIGDHNLDLDAEAVLDNGSYNIDHLLTNTSVKKIFFSLVSGNTSSAITPTGNKISFCIATFDHHTYYVVD
jgi:hypothetical protein